MNTSKVSAFRRWMLIGSIVWLTAGYSVAFAHLQMFEPATVTQTTPAYDDAARYIAMVRGVGTAPSPFRYRVAIPAMASLVPEAIVVRLTTRPQPSPEWLAGAKLSVVNALMLALTSAVLFLLGVVVGLEYVEAMLLSLLFFCLRPVLQYGGVPTIDASSWLVIAAGATALAAGSDIALLLIAFAGMFIKETTLLLVPLAVLRPADVSSRVRSLAAIVPGLIAYLAFRAAYQPSAHGDVFGAWWNGARLAWLDVSTARLLTVSGWVDLLSAFGLVWIPAVIAWRDARTPRMLRWCAVIVPAMLCMMMWLGTNLGRVMFLAFPVVLPSAVFGVRWLLQSNRMVVVRDS